MERPKGGPTVRAEGCIDNYCTLQGERGVVLCATVRTANCNQSTYFWPPQHINRRLANDYHERYKVLSITTNGTVAQV